MKKYVLSSPPRSSRIDYQGELNPQQYAVVSAGEGPLLIIAGAGSGKTRTLTYRVAHLMDRGIRPSAILLCTFTNKAAREMLSRVEHLVESNARQVWGGTFHHLANRILRELAPRLGYSPSYTILDQEDSRELVATCIAERERGATKKLLPRPAVLADHISFSTNTQTPLDQVILHRAPALLPVMDELLAVAKGYRDRKRAIEAMDFDDLLTNLKSLMTDVPDLAEEVAGRYQHVLVDEYQDTNALQCDLVDLLASVHGNLTVVGDDAQSIYGFRGANPGNMLSFAERWPACQLFKLEINYRSTPEILNLANASIRNNAEQLPKELCATRPAGARPALVTVRDVATQAAFVAQRVTELSQEGGSLSDMAVVYRAHSHSLEVQVELTRQGIPYMVRSGVRFFEQAHIKDVLAHLRILENSLDELSWMRVLKLQPGIGRTTALRIWESLTSADDPLEAALSGAPPARLSSRARPGYEQLVHLLQEARREDVRERASQVIQTVLDGGYRDLLPTLYVNARSRQDDIEQLARYADNFDSLGAFLSELNLLSGFSTEEVLEGKPPDEFLTLTSIHQAKGLEWKVVFALALNEGLFPHPWALTEAGGDDQEERRLFYVAVTRTMDELYLLSPLVAERARGRRALLKPSRFLAEVDDDALLERWEVEDGPG